MKSRLAVLAWLTALAILLAWVLATFVAERTVPTLLLTSFGLPQFWLAPALLLLLLSGWRRDRRALAGSLAACVLALLTLGWQRPDVRPDPPPTFRLMTYNIARGAGGAAALAQSVMAQEPDVLCLQETNTVSPGVLAELERRLPGYRAVRSREVTLLTRFPVRSQQETALPNTTRRLLRATLTVNGDPLTVLDVHFTTVLLGGGWQQARTSRAAQLRAVLAQAQNTAGPLVVCGDFNTPPRGLIYAGLEQAFSNAFDQAGSGLGYTFPSGFPLVRIDHVWLRGARAVRASVPDSRASDHRPLVVDIALP